MISLRIAKFGCAKKEFTPLPMFFVTAFKKMTTAPFFFITKSLIADEKKWDKAILILKETVILNRRGPRGRKIATTLKKQMW